MRTNLDIIKDKAIQLIYTELKAEEGFNVCQHPYISTLIIENIYTKKSFNLFQDTEEYHRWQEQFKEDILRRKNACSVFALIRPAYRMAFFKDINQYLSVKDFPRILADCWASHGGRDIPVKKLVAWFNKADKMYLMSKREYKIFSELPEQVTIYRGSSSQYKYGLSWTLDKKVAFWYAEKYENQGSCVYECIVDKNDLLCYFETRNEAEIIIIPSSLKHYKMIKHTKKI